MRDMALREKKDALMAPMARQWFAVADPNLVSLIALGVGLLAAAAVVTQQYWLGLGLWALNRVLDGLDGVIARVHHKQSDFGGYLDLLLDFVVYLAVPVAFLVAMPSLTNLWAGVALFAAYVINLLSWSILSALLEKRQWQCKDRLTSLAMPVGLIEGAETILFYALFFVLPGYLAWLFGLMAALVLFTAGQRVWWAYRNLQVAPASRRLRRQGLQHELASPS